MFTPYPQKYVVLTAPPIEDTRYFDNIRASKELPFRQYDYPVSAPCLAPFVALRPDTVVVSARTGVVEALLLLVLCFYERFSCGLPW